MTQSENDLRERLAAIVQPNEADMKFIESKGCLSARHGNDVHICDWESAETFGHYPTIDKILALILAERRAADTKTLETVASILSGTGGSGDITAERVVEIAQSYIRNKLQLNNGEPE